MSLLYNEMRGTALRWILPGMCLGGRALCCKGLDPPAWWIDNAWQIPLQFELFFVTIGPSKVVVCAVLSVGKFI